MEEDMTDKQMEVILNLVADKFSKCKDMDEVTKAVQEIRNMAKKEKPSEQALGKQKGRRTCQSRPNCIIIIDHLARKRKKEITQIEGKRRDKWMTRAKSGDFDQIRYQSEYNKKNYDRIEIKVQKGKKEIVKAAATAAGQSVNEYICQAINERMENDR